MRAAGLALACLLGACGGGPAPGPGPTTALYRQLAAGPDADAVRRAEPELVARAEEAHRRSLDARASGDLDDAEHHARLAVIYWRTAAARAEAHALLTAQP